MLGDGGWEPGAGLCRAKLCLSHSAGPAPLTHPLVVHVRWRLLGAGSDLAIFLQRQRSPAGEDPPPPRSFSETHPAWVALGRAGRR